MRCDHLSPLSKPAQNGKYGSQEKPYPHDRYEDAGGPCGAQLANDEDDDVMPAVELAAAAHLRHLDTENAGAKTDFTEKEHQRQSARSDENPPLGQGQGGTS
jgi:hypothetical protein